MTTLVAATTPVVNIIAATSDNDRCWVRYDPGVSTLLQRIEEILATQGISARELARRSELAEQHVSTSIARLRKNPAAAIALPTLEAMARGAKVSSAWLITGAGTPNASDRSEPSRTESSEPIAENIPGYAEVEAADRQAHTGIDEVHWLAARKAAAYVIHGPAAPGDALKLARLAQEFADPERVRRAFAEQEERIKAMAAEHQRQLQEFQQQLAELKAGGKPKRGAKKKAGE